MNTPDMPARRGPWTVRRRLLALSVACAACGSARADYFLVVQAGNAQATMTQKEAVDLFMSRKRTFRNGDTAVVVDLPRDDPKREGFYRALTGLSLAQVNSYWSRLMFSGESRPPQSIPDENAALEMVRRNPNALAWVTREPTEKQVHTVLVLKEPS